MQERLLSLEVEVTRLLSKIIKAPYVQVQETKLIGAMAIDQEDSANRQVESIDIEKQEVKEKRKQILQAAKEEADAIIREAKMQKEQILLRVEEEKQKAFQDAFMKGQQEGQEQGYQEGYMQGKKEANHFIKEAEQIRISAQQEKEQILQEIEPQALELIVNILEKMVGSLIKFQPETILYLIQKGLKEVSFKDTISLYISEKDYEYVMDHQTELFQLIGEEGALEILKEPSLEMGDCIIETPVGNIDSGLGHQLQEVKKELYLLFAQEDAQIQ